MNVIKSFFREAYYFVSSKIFWKYFGGIVAFLSVFLLLLFWILNWYTMHGEFIEVPKLKGKSVAEADKLLRPLGLVYVVSDSAYNPDLTPGTILEQTPKEQSKVKESRTIYLIVNRSNPPDIMIAYSDVIGRPLKEVERRFQALGLRVGKKEYIEGRAANTIAMVKLGRQLLFKEVDAERREKAPKEPQKVPQGSVVDLVLYKGNDAEAKEVPDLVCQTFGRAEGMIKMHKFVLGQVNVEPNVRDTLRAYVRQQDPPAYMRVSMGSGVSVWLSSEKPKACEEEE
jgi:beta-lactam-binding protein with PASTA domain